MDIAKSQVKTLQTSTVRVARRTRQHRLSKTIKVLVSIVHCLTHQTQWNHSMKSKLSCWHKIMSRSKSLHKMKIRWNLWRKGRLNSTRYLLTPSNIWLRLSNSRCCITIIQTIKTVICNPQCRNLISWRQWETLKNWARKWKETHLTRKHPTWVDPIVSSSSSLRNLHRVTRKWTLPNTLRRVLLRKQARRARKSCYMLQAPTTN